MTKDNFLTEYFYHEHAREAHHDAEKLQYPWDILLPLSVEDLSRIIKWFVLFSVEDLEHDHIKQGPASYALENITQVRIVNI